MRLILLVRFLQVLAVLGIIVGLTQGVVDAIYDPRSGLGAGTGPRFVAFTVQDRVEQFVDPVSRTVMRLLGPGMLLVLCEIAVILDRRLPNHPDTAP